MTQCAETFLDLYKQLEDELDSKYKNAKRRYTSVVIEYLKDSQSEPVRDRLEMCREVRNVLTHNANFRGEPIVEPSQNMVDAMNEILEYVKEPPLALDYAIKGDRIMKATMSQKVLRVMEVMEKNGYSHVPVMKDGIFKGVFSVGTVFTYILKGQKHINKETTLAELANHLPVSEHSECYEFVPKDAPYLFVRKQFEKIKAKNRKVSVVFITETGKQNERLLGMMVPWDVMGEP